MYKFYDVDNIIIFQQVSQIPQPILKSIFRLKATNTKGLKGRAELATEKDEAFKAAEYWKSQYFELEESLNKDSENNILPLKKSPKNGFLQQREVNPGM